MSTHTLANQAVPSQGVVDKFVGVCHGRLEQVKTMLAEHPGLINAASSQNETGLQAASHTGQKEIVKFLVSNGAPMNICTAAVLGLTDEVTRRLDADPSQKDATGAHGLPVMLHAAIGGSLDVVTLLASRGAAVNGGEGVSTPLHGAVWADAPAVVQWLLEHGANTDGKDYAGKTAADAARQLKRERLLQLFEAHASKR